MTIRVDLVPKPPYPYAVLLLDARSRAVSGGASSWLKPSLAKAVAAGCIAKPLRQALGKCGSLQEVARLATSLLHYSPDPLEPLLRSDLGQQLYRAGRSEDLASLFSLEDLVPRLTQIRVLEAKQCVGFCFRAR